MSGIVRPAHLGALRGPDRSGERRGRPVGEALIARRLVLVCALVALLALGGLLLTEPAAAQPAEPGGSFSLDADNSNASGVWGNHTTIYVANDGAGRLNKIFAYHRSDGSRDESKDILLWPNDNADPRGIWSDGRTMYVVDQHEAKIFAYQLADDPRTLVDEYGKPDPDLNISLNASDTRAEGLWGNDTHLFTVSDVDDEESVFPYRRSNGSIDWDAGPDEDDFFDAGIEDPAGLWGNDDYMFVLDIADDRVYSFQRSDKSHDPFGAIPLQADNGDPEGLWSDGRVLYVVDSIEDEIYVYALPRADSRVFWFGELTAATGTVQTNIGYLSADQTGSLSPSTFSATDQYTVGQLYTNATQLKLEISDHGNEDDWVLVVGGLEFDFADATRGSDGSTSTWTWARRGVAFAAGQQVGVALRVDAADAAPTGQPTVRYVSNSSDTTNVRVGGVVEADVSAISDANGILPGAFRYLWYRDGAPIQYRTFSNGKQIMVGHRPSCYLESVDQGSALSVAVWVADIDGNEVGPLTSAATAAVQGHYFTPGSDTTFLTLTRTDEGIAYEYFAYESQIIGDHYLHGFQNTVEIERRKDHGPWELVNCLTGMDYSQDVDTDIDPDSYYVYRIRYAFYGSNRCVPAQDLQLARSASPEDAPQATEVLGTVAALSSRTSLNDELVWAGGQFESTDEVRAYELYPRRRRAAHDLQLVETYHHGGQGLTLDREHVWVATDAYETGNPLGFIPYLHVDGSFVETAAVQTTDNILDADNLSVPQPTSTDIYKVGDTFYTLLDAQKTLFAYKASDGSRDLARDIELPALPGSPSLSSIWIDERSNVLYVLAPVQRVVYAIDMYDWARIPVLDIEVDRGGELEDMWSDGRYLWLTSNETSVDGSETVYSAYLRAVPLRPERYYSNWFETYLDFDIDSAAAADRPCYGGPLHMCATNLPLDPQLSVERGDVTITWQEPPTNLAPGPGGDLVRWRPNRYSIVRSDDFRPFKELSCQDPNIYVYDEELDEDVPIGSNRRFVDRHLTPGVNYRYRIRGTYGGPIEIYRQEELVKSLNNDSHCRPNDQAPYTTWQGDDLEVELEPECWAEEGECHAPRSLSARLVDDGVALRWLAPFEDPGSVDSYEILRRRPNRGEPEFSVLVADTGSRGTTYTDTTATEPGTRYTYRVKAIREGVRSERSRYATAMQPPLSGTLVGNLRQPRSGADADLTQQYAVEFRLGDHGQGYEISAVSIDLAAVPTNLTVSLWIGREAQLTIESSEAPEIKLFDFDNPNSFTVGRNWFTAPPGAFAYQNVSYFIVLSGFDTSLSIKETTSDAEDSGGEIGATLGNSARVRALDANGRWSTFSTRASVLRLAVQGSKRDRSILASNYAQTPAGVNTLSIGDKIALPISVGAADRYLIRGVSLLADSTVPGTPPAYNPLDLRSGWTTNSEGKIDSAGTNLFSLTATRYGTGINEWMAPQGATVSGSGSYLIYEDFQSVPTGTALIRIFKTNSYNEDTPTAPGVTLSAGLGSIFGMPLMAVLGEPLHALVSNLGQSDEAYVALEGSTQQSLLQVFDTGSNQKGYRLQGIGVRIEGSDKDGAAQIPDGPSSVSLALYRNDVKQFDLVSPDEYTAGELSFFEAPPDSVLEPNVQYRMVWKRLGGAGQRLGTTTSNDEDAGGLPGFRIWNTLRSGADLTDSTSLVDASLQMAVYGEAIGSTDAEPSVYEVRPDWLHIPDGVEVGDRFRLAFLSFDTSHRPDATSSRIEDYNAHVQERAAEEFNDRIIRAIAPEFKAVVCTQATAARTNTDMWDDVGVPVHWLDGGWDDLPTLIAETYDQFYQDWENFLELTVTFGQKPNVSNTFINLEQPAGTLSYLGTTYTLTSVEFDNGTSKQLTVVFDRSFPASAFAHLRIVFKDETFPLANATRTSNQFAWSNTGLSVTALDVASVVLRGRRTWVNPTSAAWSTGNTGYQASQLWTGCNAYGWLHPQAHLGTTHDLGMATLGVLRPTNAYTKDEYANLTPLGPIDNGEFVLTAELDERHPILAISPILTVVAAR